MGMYSSDDMYNIDCDSSEEEDDTEYCDSSSDESSKSAKWQIARALARRRMFFLFLYKLKSP